MQQEVAVVRGRGLDARARWWMWLPLVLAALGLLAVAEVRWLPQSMPREYVARTSLVLVPAQGVILGQEDGWTRAILNNALDQGLLQDLATRLDLRDKRSGEPLSSERLRQRMRASAQCVEAGGSGRGLRLSMTVRGPDGAEAATIAEAWSRDFLRESALVAVAPKSAPLVPYLPCEEP